MRYRTISSTRFDRPQLAIRAAINTDIHHYEGIQFGIVGFSSQTWMFLNSGILNFFIIEFMYTRVCACVSRVFLGQASLSKYKMHMILNTFDFFYLR